MGAENAAPQPPSPAAPQRAERSSGPATTRPQRGAAPKRPKQGSGVTADSEPAAHKDPLITRTYRIPESLDQRMQAASLQLGVERGKVVNKTDVVREAVETWLDELGL